MEVRNWKKMKKALSVIMAAAIFTTSIPPVPVFAKQEVGYAEGDGNDVDVDIIHELRAGNTEADIFVKASASNADYEEPGDVTRVEVKDSEGKRIKGGMKAKDAVGEEVYRFRVKKNDTYTVYVYYETQAELEPRDGVNGGGGQGADIPSSPAETEGETVEAETADTEAGKETDTVQAETPEAETPEAETPEVETPEAETPEAEIPEAETSETAVPESETEAPENHAPEPLALKAMDFLFPVIDAYGASRSVEKVLIYDYEINDLYTKGVENALSVSIDIQEEGMGSKVTILASPSDAYQEGEAFIQGITLLADKDDAFYLEDDVREFEYQESEYDVEQGSATFYVWQNGLYHIGISYDDALAVGENLKSVLIPYEINSKYGISYIGADDVTIAEGTAFELMDGVRAVDRDGADVAVVVTDDGGFRANVPGTYIIIYAPVSEMRARSTVLNNAHERIVKVAPLAAGDLTIVSNIHGEESGKTLMILPLQPLQGILTVSFKVPSGETERYLKFELPNWISVDAWPSDGYGSICTTYIDEYTMEYSLRIEDDVSAGVVSFELSYTSDIPFLKKLPGGVESYVYKKGIVNIGKIKVSSGYRDASRTEVEIDRQEIGEFMTEPIIKSTDVEVLGLKNGNSRWLRPVVHQFLYDFSLGDQPFDSRPASGNDSDWLFSLSTDHYFYSGQPYKIEKVKVFAPENFTFGISDGYTDKITLGQEASGVWYADVIVNSDNGSALNGLILEKEDESILKSGTYTSFPSIVTYTTYRENEEAGLSLVTETYETTPLVSVTGECVVYEETDRLYVGGYKDRNNELSVGEIRSDFFRMSMSNIGGGILKEEDGLVYRSEPQDVRGLIYAVKMPGTNQIVPVHLNFNFANSPEQETRFPAYAKIKEIRVTLTDGIVKIFSPEEMGLSDDGLVPPSDYTGRVQLTAVFPAGEYLKRVDTVDVVMDRLYSYSTEIYLGVSVNPDIASLLPIDGEWTVTAGSWMAKLKDTVIEHGDGSPGIQKLYPRRNWKLAQLEDYEEEESSFQRSIAIIDSGQEGLGTAVGDIEIICDFTNDDERSKFLDTLKVYYPGTITIESMGGDSRTYEAVGEDSTFNLNPWSNDYIKKLILKFPSITKTRDTSSPIANISGNMDFNDWKEASTYLKEDELRLAVECAINMNSSAWMNLDTSIRIDIGPILVKGEITSLESPYRWPYEYTEYQGNILEYSLPDYRFLFSLGSRLIETHPFLSIHFRWMYPDTYVFLNAEDSLSFVGVEAPWKYARIPSADGTVIKLYREDEPPYSYLWGYAGYTPLLTPKLKFNVLPGGTEVRAIPIKEIWFSMDQIQDLEHSWLTENARILKFPTDRFEPGTGLTDHNVIKYTEETDFDVVNILKSNKTGLFLTAGVNGSYVGDEAEGKSGDVFEARAYLQTGSSMANDYEAILTLPRDGVSMTDEVGTDYTSEYSMYLDRAVSVTDRNGTRLKALYQVSGGLNYIESSAVADWKQVTKIKLAPEAGTSLAAGTEQIISFSMSSSIKDGLGDQTAYLSAEYSTEGISGKYKPISYKLVDYMVAMDGWKDDNENGRFDLTEPTIYEYELDVYENNLELTAGTDYKITAADSPMALWIPNGKNISIRLDMSTIPSGYKLLPADTTSSSFDKVDGRLNIASLSRDDNTFNLGVVKIGTLDVGNLSVKEGLKISLEPVWTSLPDKAPTDEYTYSYTLTDETIASINGKEVKGLKPGTTIATVTAVNKFGDAVTKEFYISVGTNLPPVVNARNWTIIEGDTVDDIWAGVFLYNPKDTFPASVSEMNQSRMVTEQRVTVWTDSEKTTKISLEEALRTPGLYTVTYEVKAEDFNTVSDDGILTVYGKLQQSEIVGDGHFYLPQEGGVVLDSTMFSYKNPDGTDVWVEVPQTNSITIPGVNTARFDAVHPKIDELSADVKAGSERTASATATIYVDSTPALTGLPTTLLTIMTGTSINLLTGIGATYTHYSQDTLSGDVSNADIVLTDGGGNLITSEVMMTQPGIYTYNYTATAPELYKNEGLNQSTATRSVNVIGKAEISVDSGTVYVTPTQSEDEDYILSKTTVTAFYVDAAGDSQTIHPDNISYTYEKDGDVITRITVHASVNVGGVQNSAEFKMVDVVVRKIPEIQASPILLRADVLRDESSVDVEVGITIEPAGDAFNTYTVKKNINPKKIGRYEAVFTTTDSLTGATAEYIRYVYVSGNPELKASQVTISTHQSLDKDALIEAVKRGIENPVAPGSYMTPTGEVTYVLADGTLKIVELDGADIAYEVEDGYQPATEGTYKVALTVKDTNALSQSDLAGITEASALLRAEVVVSDHSYTVTIQDGGTGKGTFKEGTVFIPSEVLHGNTLVQLPTLDITEGYHFNGYRTENETVAKKEIVIGGTIILAGEIIPKGAVLSEENIRNVIVESDITFTAVFSAVPAVIGETINLYQNEIYDHDAFQIKMEDLDDTADDKEIFHLTYDDIHVDTSVPGTYQVNVTVTDKQENMTEKHLYVQVVGRPEVTENSDMVIRAGDALTAAAIAGSITATYKKPADIPSNPWDDTAKSNIAVSEEQITITEGMISTLPDTEAADLKQVDINIWGAIEGKEEQGNTVASKKLYIYGKPVIVADYNELFTHLAVNENALIEAIQTGLGSGALRQPTVAYMDIPSEDGTIKRAVINNALLTYQVYDFISATEGNYEVSITVNDSSIISELGLDQKGITPVTVTQNRGVAVGSRIYNVGFEAGEHGSFEGGSSIQIPVVHGKSPLVPYVNLNEGYELVGWVDQAGTRISDLANYTITADTAITAIYEKQEFTVRFFGQNNLIIKTEKVKYEGNATVPVDHPDVQHRLFDGWDKEFSSIKENLDVRAKYRSNSGEGEDSEGGNPEGGNPEGGNPEGEDSEGESGNSGDVNNFGQDISDDNVPLSNLDIRGIIPDNMANGNSLPVLEDDKPIEVLKTGKGGGNFLSVKKVGGQNGLGEKSTEQSNNSIPEKTVPKASAPESAMQKRESCIIHIILLLSAALGAIYQMLRICKNKKKLDELNEKLGNDREER